ncbi:MAG: DNA polymerase III subunit delta [Elusimicrobia bacterium]|nr:DNA polymerase III subunit delta [Elusimicrobiota bacterium]
MAVPGQRIPVVTILSGDDEFTKREIRKDIESRLTGIFGNCETIIIDGIESPAHRIRDEVLGNSLFSSHKLVIITEADTLLTDSSFTGFLSKQGASEDATCYILIETTLGANKLKKISAVSIQQVNTPYENKIPSWIKTQFTGRGRQITEDAAGLLLFHCGRNLYNISAEIEKIITAYPDKDVYHVDEISSVVGQHKKDDIFGFINSLVDGNEKKAFRLLRNLLDYGTQPLNILGMIKWKVQQLIIIRSLMRKGLEEKEIIQRLGLHYYFNMGICRKLNRFSMDKLLDIYNSIQKTDLELKSTSTDDSLLIEKFSMKFFI